MSKVNYCACGFSIKEMDDTLFDLEKHVLKTSSTIDESEWVTLLEKAERVQMAIDTTSKVCNMRFKDAKKSSSGLHNLLAEADTNKMKKNVTNRINKISSEIYRELDNCADMLRKDMD